MADVFKARDPLLNIDVALKMMKAPLSDSGHEEAERFLRDARALARLDHPNIVRVYDVGTHDGRAYFTMGFVAGGSLDGHADRFTDPLAAAMLVEKVARAMQFVHEHGVLHRDLKPANILIDEEGEPRVGDFGLAKFRDDDLEITREGVAMGTVPYMAPEQARGQTQLFGPATDVWALGVILYELLTRRRPFEAKSREAIASLICTAEPPRLRTARADIDGGLEDVVLKCLEKRPKDRYASAAELADDLRRWRLSEPRPGGWRPSSLTRRVRRWVRHHRIACTIAAVALLSGLSLLALRPGVPVESDNAAPATPVHLEGDSAERAKPEPTDSEVLERVRSELEQGQGQAVRLLPDAGLAMWYRRRVEADVPLSRSGETLTVKNFRPGLVELLPESPADGYRLTAEVYIANKAHSPATGIFVACREHLAPDDVPEHWWVSLAFPCAPTVPRAAVNVHRYRAGDSKTGFHFPTEVQRRGLAGQPWEGVWRHLAIEVRSQGVTAFWEGQRIGGIDLSELQTRIDLLSGVRVALPVDKRPTAAFLLHGGLGLYNDDAFTTFRQVTLELLK
jgi:serine/threonine-protein kinase